MERTTLVRTTLAASIVTASLLAAMGARAATETWSGATDTNWNTSGNWTGGNPIPATGDIVIFDASSSQFTSNNNINSLSLAGLTFATGAGGFNLSGNAVALTGPLTVNAANSIAQTIGLAVNGTSASSLLIGSDHSGGNSLTLGANSAFGSMTVSSNSTTANSLNVGATTLTLTGAFVIGTAPVDSNNTNAVLNVSGGGTFNVIPSSNANFNLGVGAGSNTPGGRPNVTVDMTGLANFVYNTGAAGSGQFGVGNLITRASSTLRLANTSNVITAASVVVGDSNQPGGNNNGAGGFLFLGTGTNVINTNTINIGFTKSTGAIQFQDPSLGSVVINGQTGGTSTTNITIGSGSSATDTGTKRQLLLAGHMATVQAGTVIIGRLAGSTGGTTAGELTFDTGTFSASSVQLAVDSSGTAANGVAGTLTVGGPTADSSATGVLNVSTQFLMGNVTNTGTTTKPNNSTFAINGGTANINTDIASVKVSQATGTTLNSTLTLAGGTLNMMNHNIGSYALPITTVNLNSGTLNGAISVAGKTINLQPTATISGGTNFVLADGGTLNSNLSPLTLASGSAISGGGVTSGQVNGEVVAGSGAKIAPGSGGALGTLQFNSPLTLGTGSNLAIKLSDTSSDRVDALSGLTLSGTVNLQIGTAGAGPTVGNTYTIANYSGLTGNETNFNVIGNGTRMTFAVVPTATTPSTIQVSVGGSAPLALTWIGNDINNPNNWDLNSTPNWRNPSLSADKFFNLDQVTFDDTSTNTNPVQLVGQLTPGSVTVNASRDYTFAGSGSVAGTTGITKSGTGTLTLVANNTYSGGTTINAGTVQIGNGGTAGSVGTGQVTITGGTLKFNRSDAVTFSNVISGAGGVTQGSPSTGVVTLSGANTYTGPTLISSGTVKVTNFNALGALAGGNVTISSGATLDIGGFSAANVTNGFNGKQFFISGTGVDGKGAIYNSGISENTAFQLVTLTGDATIGGLATTFTNTPGRFDMRASANVANPVLDLAGFTLTKSGNSQFTLVNAEMKPGDLILTASTGQPVRNTLSIETTSTILAGTKPDMTTPYTVTLNDFTNLQFFNLTSTNVTRQFVFNGDVLVSNANSALSTFTGPIQLNSGSILRAGATQGGANNPIALSGAITGSGRLIKEGTSTLTLNGNNTYSGSTTVSSGTLALGAADRISNSSDLVLGGGIFNTGGFSETVNKLTLTASSHIDVGAAVAVNELHFANSSLTPWTGALTIDNWSGLQSGNGIDRVFVGSNNYSGLTHAQLNAIQFTGSPTPGAILLATGELVPNQGSLLPAIVPGDFNLDTHTTASDIGPMLSAMTDLSKFQTTSQLSDGDLRTLGDLDISGLVDNRDMQGLLVLLANGGGSAPGGGSLTAVPEPASIVLLGVGCLLFAVRGRKHLSLATR